MCLYTVHHLICTHTVQKRYYCSPKSTNCCTARRITNDTYGPGICERFSCRESHNLLPPDWNHTASLEAHYKSQPYVPYTEPFDMSAAAREESERRWLATLPGVAHRIRHGEISGPDFVRALRPACSYRVPEGHGEKACSVEDAVAHVRVHGVLPECSRVPMWAANPRYMSVEQLWLYTGVMVEAKISDPFAELPGMMIGPDVEENEDEHEDEETVVGESFDEREWSFSQREVEAEHEGETEGEHEEHEEEEEDYFSTFEPPEYLPPAPVGYNAPPFTGRHDILPKLPYYRHWYPVNASSSAATAAAASGTATAGSPPSSSPGDDLFVDNTLTMDDFLALGDATTAASADEPSSSFATITATTTETPTNIDTATEASDDTTEVPNNPAITTFVNNDPTEGDFSSSFPSLPSLTSTEFASQDSGRHDTWGRDRDGKRKYAFGDGMAVCIPGPSSSSASRSGSESLDNDHAFHAQEFGEED